MADRSDIGETLDALAETIHARSLSADADVSYTAQLLKKGPSKIAKKLIEEAGELGLALAVEGDDEVASEAADVLYHLLVGLASRGVTLERVAQILSAREGLSGLEEKANRE